ncbi:hypothetical protein, partial, partial [Absidia glauca]
GLGGGNDGVEGWSFYGQMERDGKVYRSVCSVGGDIAGMPSGKEVVLVLAPEDPGKKKNCFFAMLLYYFEVTINNNSVTLAAVYALDGVTQDKKALRGAIHDKHVDGRLYPYWQQDHGLLPRLIVIDASQIGAAVLLGHDENRPSFKNLIVAKLLVWEYQVLDRRSIIAMY